MQIMKVKYARITLVVLFIAGCCYGCNRDQAFMIEPIDAEFNVRLRTGKGLRPELFSTTDVLQYYQIDNCSNLRSADLKRKLNDFSDKYYKQKRLAKIQQLTILFYQKQLFTDYGDHLYECARDNENGTLNGYADYLKARIYFIKLSTDSNKVVRHTNIYNAGNKTVSSIDTLQIK